MADNLLNNNPKKDEYYYTLFESGNKGFVLKEEYEPRKFQYQLTEEFFDLSALVGEKFHNGISEEKLLEEIGYSLVYELNSHKEEIISFPEGFCSVLGTSKDKSDKNTMYIIVTSKKITDFSNLPRHTSSRYTVFLGSIRNDEGEKLSNEMFMN